MNICTECDHCEIWSYSRHPDWYRLHVCRHPNSWVSGKLDPVTGVYMNEGWHSCASMRSENAPCGPEGKTFTPFEEPKRIYSHRRVFGIFPVYDKIGVDRRHKTNDNGWPNFIVYGDKK
jgi:hypothetical protein